MIQLHRTGYIKTNAQSPNQCKDVGHTDYRYSAMIECEDSDLDNNGFIIDHTVIHKLIEKFFQANMDSCEVMVSHCGNAIRNCCIAHGVHPKQVTLRINPVPDASKQQNPENVAFFEWYINTHKN